MKLEDQVCTLEQSKKLSALGISQNSLFYYTQYNVPTNPNLPHYGYRQEYMPIDILMGRQSKVSGRDVFFEYSAFNVAELGVMLPPGFDTMFCSNEGWRGYDAEGNDFKDTPYATEAELRADMIIQILEKFPDDGAYRTQISWRLQK